MAKKKHISEEDVLPDGIIAMMKNRSKHCSRCKHFHKGSDDVVAYGTCDAYSKGLPVPIWLGETVHDRRMFGQTNTLTFEESE